MFPKENNFSERYQRYFTRTSKTVVCRILLMEDHVFFTENVGFFFFNWCVADTHCYISFRCQSCFIFLSGCLVVPCMGVLLYLFNMYFINGNSQDFIILPFIHQISWASTMAKKLFQDAQEDISEQMELPACIRKYNDYPCICFLLHTCKNIGKINS